MVQKLRALRTLAPSAMTDFISLSMPMNYYDSLGSSF